MSNSKEQVNHPQHYNNGGIEVIEMMERIWGREAVILFCRMNAFKYRMRMGYKDEAVQELQKAKWYENHAKRLENPNVYPAGPASDETVYERTRRINREAKIIPQDRTHETD